MIGNLHSRKLLALLALSIAHPAFADDAIVGSGALPSCTELALDAALDQLYPGANFPGGVLSFNCGPNPVVIPISTRKSLTGATIVDGGDRITLDGQNGSAIFAVDGAESRVEIRNIDLFRGRAQDSYGGAINVGAGTTLLIADSKIRASFASLSGGAIHVEPGAGLRIERSELIENTAMNGGAIASNSAVTLVGCIFSGNVASSNEGGAVQAWFGGVTVSGSQFFGNSARHGGALLLRGGQSQLTTSVFDDNSAIEQGGAIALYDGATLQSAQVRFTRNRADQGGALHLGGTDTGAGPEPAAFGAGASIEHAQFEANEASLQGGAIDIFGPPPGNGGTIGVLILTDSSLQANISIIGGAIRSAGQFIAEDVRFERNAAANGGAVALAPVYQTGMQFAIAYTNMHRVTFQSNAANNYGGAMHIRNALPNFGALNFVGNSARFGGGIFAQDFSTPLRNASFVDNLAVVDGGGLYAWNVGNLPLDNLTFSGNKTFEPDGHGGDIFAYANNLQAAELQVSHSTLYGSVADHGSALYSNGPGSRINLKNSLVLGFGADTCATGSSGVIASTGGNFMPGGCNPLQPTDVPISSAGELGLGALTNNGAYLYSHVPIVGSAVIDHVACPPERDADQRDQPAPIDGDGNGSALCDSGAIERQPVEAPADIVLLKDGFEQNTD
ncbi:MAG: hypothetical protein KA763_06955 [Xanthomonadales bacterium]|nr:hypothetical protein [Xanthomonadales bacterium]